MTKLMIIFNYFFDGFTIFLCVVLDMAGKSEYNY